MAAALPGMTLQPLYNVIYYVCKRPLITLLQIRHDIIICHTIAGLVARRQHSRNNPNLTTNFRIHRRSDWTITMRNYFCAIFRADLAVPNKYAPFCHGTGV